MRNVFLLALILVFTLSAGCARVPEAPPVSEVTPAPAASAAPVQPPVSTEPAAPEEYLAAVTFINVGKADAILIQAAGRSYLVDTGEKSSLPALIGTLRLLGVEALDGLFITHTHSDHIGGARGVAACFPISEYYTAAFTLLTDKGKDKLAELSADIGVEQTRLSAGDRVDVSDGIWFDTLAPLELNTDDDNDNSLVLMLHVNDTRVLLTGDMQLAEETSLLLDGGGDVAADVLKVGNHGNPDATGDGFARAVSPDIAVISTDTSVDADSANARVRAALSMAEIYVTEDYDAGVQVLIGEIVSAAALSRPASALSLSVTNIDSSAQTVTVRNDGADADISGVMLLSEKGNQLFIFPSGAFLASGAELTVAAEGGVGDYIWAGEKKPWKEKDDPASLYDGFGARIFG